MKEHKVPTYIDFIVTLKRLSIVSKYTISMLAAVGHYSGEIEYEIGIE